MVRGHGVSSSYTYDTAGDLASTTSASITTTYAYDQLGQMTGVAPAPAGVTGYQYTGDGLEAATLRWSAASNVDGSSVLSAISCPTTTFCAAVDQSGYEFTYNGSTWTKNHIDPSKTLSSVSCPTTTFCVAVDQAGDDVVLTGMCNTVESGHRFRLIPAT